MVPLWVEGIRRLGEWLPYMFFGLFGRKETNKYLKMRKHQIKILKVLSLTTFLCGFVYMDGNTLFLIDFVDWLGSC